MFASRITDTFALPSAPDVAITVKKLTFLQRQQAEQKAKLNRIQELAQREGMDLLRTLKRQADQDVAKARTGQADTLEEPTTEEADHDPKELYDVQTVLRYGVKDWTATEKNEKGEEVKVPVTIQNILDLDDQEYVFDRIVRLSVPMKRSEEKNALALSTAS